MKQPFLSIVIPAYNEETNIRLGALDKVSRYLEHQTYRKEVIVVDDGSTDATGDLLDDFVQTNKDFRVIHKAHSGKAGTVIEGVLAAKGELVLFTDLDQATPLHELERLLPYFASGYDIVIGSRNARREGAPVTRVIMAKGFMMLRALFLGLRGITDTQCGFKAFRREVAVSIVRNLKLYGHGGQATGSMVTAGFDIEVLFVAKKKKYKIKEVPVEWHYVETRRVSPLKDSLFGLVDMIKIRVNAWRGLYR